MKVALIVIFVLLGFYWLVAHTSLPLNHEQLGLFDHTIHNMMGVGFLVAAAVVAFFWKKK